MAGIDFATLRGMRSPHLGRLIAIIGLGLVVLVGIALANTSSPIFITNHPSVASSSLEPPPTTTSTFAPALGPRPRDISLERVNPCAILTSSQRADLSLDAQPKPYTNQE
ncbi:MAG: hypothetical protein ACREP9_03435, partial [Candidatus Dormibacteraceae bacterium]